jgi:hypothetical protein
MVIGLWIALALAQEPTEPAPAEPTTTTESRPVDGKPMEIIVYGEVLVDRARDQLMETAKDQGYAREIRRDGFTILRHDDPWKGEIRLYDDGRVEVHRQPVRFEPPFARKTPLAWLTCVVVPLCIRPNGQLVSPRKFHAQERRALEAIEPDAVVYNDRIADWATDRKADQTGAHLADLWTSGKPIDGDVVLESFEARRQAILAYWDSRTDSEWGDQIRARIESFIRGEVQQGEHPFTVAEIDAFNANHRSTRVFPDVTRPRPESLEP